MRSTLIKKNLNQRIEPLYETQEMKLRYPRWDHHEVRLAEGIAAEMNDINSQAYQAAGKLQSEIMNAEKQNPDFAADYKMLTLQVHSFVKTLKDPILEAFEKARWVSPSENAKLQMMNYSQKNDPFGYILNLVEGLSTKFQKISVNNTLKKLQDAKNKIDEKVKVAKEKDAKLVSQEEMIKKLQAELESLRKDKPVLDAKKTGLFK